MTSTKKPNRLITIHEAAERLSVGPQSVRRMIARGQITGYRIPGVRSVRVDADEIMGKLQQMPTIEDPR